MTFPFRNIASPHFARAVMAVMWLFFLGGCAYYNTLFNAKNSYKDGLKTLQEGTGQKGGAASAKKHFETTIEKCWKLIEIYGDNNKYADDALLYICKSEFHLERYSQAKLHLEQFMKKYNNSDLLPEAQLWYGKVLLTEENLDKANEYFRLVINNSKNPQIRSQASFELGLYAFRKENYQQAIQFLETALKEKLEDEYKASVLFYLAEAYFIQKDYKKAVELYQKVEKFNPTLDIELQAQLHHARALGEMGKFAEAEKILRKMLTAPRFQPHESVIKTAIGENYEKQGKVNEALDIYHEVVQTRRSDAGTAQAAYNLAQLYENVYVELDSAVIYYGKVPKIYPKFDSIEVAQRKERTLNEFKTIRDHIWQDEYLVERLTYHPEFRDSLYTAQREDSLRRLRGEGEETPETPPPGSGPLASTGESDSLDFFGNDSLKLQGADSLTAKTPAGQDTVATQKPEDEFIGFRDRELTPKSPGATGNPPQQPENRREREKTTPKKPLEKRKLPQIEFDLMNSRYQLAEYYLLKEQNYDSAAVHFQKFLDIYEDSILTPKALYSLIYIHRSPRKQDLAKVYELEKELLAKYIDSPFAREILKNKGMLEEEEKKALSPQEQAYREFLKAESLYFAGKYRNALVEYEKIANLDSTWEISAKAQFAVAWVYEKNLGMKDSALTAYKRVIERFPHAAQYVAVARKKTQPPVERSAPAPQDTTVLAADEARPDKSAAEPTAGEIADAGALDEAGAADILKEKIRWRNRREAR